jgi:vacuolar-type H+-ATPase subunit E/Vma4
VNVASLPTYLLLEEAAARHERDVEDLERDIQEGRVQALRTLEGHVLVASEDVSLASKLEQVDVENSLEGTRIRLMDAARKYRISHANLVHWMDAGYIKVLERGPQLLVLNEADVALAVKIFKEAREETGSPIRAGWILKRALLKDDGNGDGEV